MSSSKGIEAEIQQLEQQLAPVSAQLDAKIQAFASALPTSAAAWMNAETKRRIEENADRVNAAGLESLRQLKSQLTELIATLPELCVKAVASEKDWPHRQPPASPSQSYKSPGESYFASVFRTVISNLGALLDRHGILKEPSGRIGSWEKSSGGFRYAINPGFDERSFQPLREYNDLRGKCKAQTEALETKRQELAKAKARELWDAA